MLNYLKKRLFGDESREMMGTVPAHLDMGSDFFTGDCLTGEEFYHRIWQIMPGKEQSICVEGPGGIKKSLLVEVSARSVSDTSLTGLELYEKVRNMMPGTEEIICVISPGGIKRNFRMKVTS